MIFFRKLRSFILQNPLLVIILVLAALLRFIGTNPGYPPIHTDEGISHSQGLSIVLNRSLDPVHGTSVNKFDYLVYPIVVPLINALFYISIFIPVYSLVFLVVHFGDISSLLQSNPDQLWSIISANIFSSSRVNVLFWARYVTALFGVGVVVLSYLVGKQFFRSTATGLLAAFFVAINYRQVLNSHFGLPDIYNAFFLLLAFCQMTRLFNRQTRINYILTGLIVALSFSTKFFFYIFLALAVVIFQQWLRVRSTTRVFRFLLKTDHVLMLGTAFGIILVLGIYHLIYLPETIEQINYLSLRYRVGTMALNVFAISNLYNITIGPIASLLAIFGIFAGLTRRLRPTLLLLSVLVPFLGFLLYYSRAGSLPRNFVSITPLLLIFAAFGIRQIFKLLEKHSRLPAIVLIFFLVSLVSYQSLKNSYLVPVEYSKTWNFKLAQNWLGKNLPEKSTILAYPYAPLPTKHLKVTEVKSPTDYSLAEMQEEGIEWAFINTEWMSDSFFWWMNQDTVTSFRLWNKPTAVLSNSPLARSVLELKQFIVFEALNPWQAPDNNFLVVKVPEKIKFNGGKLIYKEEFTSRGWRVVNDDYGEITNFSHDPLIGNTNPGSLKIERFGMPLYSQRFLSDKIPVTEGRVYKVKGFIRSSDKLDWDKRDGYLGLDFLSSSGEVIGTALSARVYGLENFTEREFVTRLPGGVKFVRLTFQVGAFGWANFWLDDVELWESIEQYFPDENKYLQSKFNLDEHLFLNSNGGM